MIVRLSYMEVKQTVGSGSKRMKIKLSSLQYSR